jgi:hypothetical protein
MATTKASYDPVKTVEGMFNGSVTRIAYAVKDPLNYAQSTKAVLAETTKKFQDALDDCEIQILDAKWYLEHQLALNKARREAKAREDSAASAKRKHNATEEARDKPQVNSKDNAPKRVRTAPQPEDPTQTQTQTSTQTKPSTSTSPVTKPNPKTTPKAAQKAPPKQQVPPKPQEKMPAPVSEPKAPQPLSNPAPKVQERPFDHIQIPQATLSQNMPDEFPKLTPQDTPAEGHEDFNFESMFGEPPDNVATGNNDMSFDLGLTDNFDPTAGIPTQDSSLTSLLPGLESYANQAGDDSNFNLGGTNFGMNMNMNMGMGMGMGMDASGPGPGSGSGGGGLVVGDNSLPNPDNTQQMTTNANANAFDLPDLGGPNEFDEFLNANDINFDATMGMNDDGTMDMRNMDTVDMDFDSMFA